jgi:hypothetical protein
LGEFGVRAGRATNMIPTSVELDAIADRLHRLPEPIAARPRKPGAWCPKEILGHLIDSAANNHRRFILGQLQDDLVFDGYDQEAWVRLQGYAEARWRELVDLWRHYNARLLEVVGRIPATTLDRPRPKHRLDQTAWKQLPSSQPGTLRYLIEDYFDHMQHHLRQIWSCEPT